MEKSIPMSEIHRWFPDDDSYRFRIKYPARVQMLIFWALFTLIISIMLGFEIYYQVFA